MSGGVFAPARHAPTAEGDSYLVSGRWAFASGIDHCDWLMGGCIVFENGTRKMLAEGRPDIRLALFPAAEVEVIDTWNVSGLRGTGSHDMQVARGPGARGRTTSLLTDSRSSAARCTRFPSSACWRRRSPESRSGSRAGRSTTSPTWRRKTPTISSRRLPSAPATQAAVARRRHRGARARALYAEIERAWAEAA